MGFAVCRKIPSCISFVSVDFCLRDEFPRDKWPVVVLSRSSIHRQIDNNKRISHVQRSLGVPFPRDSTVYFFLIARGAAAPGCFYAAATGQSRTIDPRGNVMTVINPFEKRIVAFNYRNHNATEKYITGG